MKFFTNKKKEVSLGNIAELQKIIERNNREIDMATSALTEISDRLMKKNEESIQNFGKEIDGFLAAIK